MWPTIARARRRLSGDSVRSERAAQEAALRAASIPSLEDVVIIFGAAEIDRLREALEFVLGDAVERPDTPARFERALVMLLTLRGAPGTPRVLRRPAIVLTPESWEIHIDGTDRATSRAVRSAGRAGFFTS